MKKCPVCNMVVDADNECPICNTSIFYEDKVPKQKEKFIFNKYYIIYMLKKCWFSIACLIFVIIKWIVSDLQFDYIHLLCPFYSLIAVIFALFHRQIARHTTWKYSKEYADFRVLNIILVFSFLGVVLSFVLYR